MKKLLTLAILFAACVVKANTYVHYSTNDNTEWCQVYDDNGKWMAAYKIVWKDETDMVGNVTLYNWNEKCLSILNRLQTRTTNISISGKNRKRLPPLCWLSTPDDPF